MQVSAEMRYWWQRQLPREIRQWCHGMPLAPGGGEVRTDVYLLDRGQSELGLKLRGGKPGVEIKGLVATESAVDGLLLPGPVQIWTKWTTSQSLLNGLPSFETDKTRWLRKYDTGSGRVREVPLDPCELPTGGLPLPQTGCNVELTEVAAGPKEDLWWTLGVEAFGTLESVRDKSRTHT